MSHIRRSRSVAHKLELGADLVTWRPDRDGGELHVGGALGGLVPAVPYQLATWASSFSTMLMSLSASYW